MEVSIIIVNWNGGSFVRDCLESIYCTSVDIGFEAIVVDNNSSDGSPDTVREIFPQVELVRNTKNLGFARAANQGIERSKGAYILLLNPDIRVEPNSLRRMVDFLDQRPEVGAVGGKLVGPDKRGEARRYYNRFPTVGQVLLNYTALGKILSRFTRTRFDLESAGQVDQPPGGCILLRRRALADVGSFDEDFFLWFEDVDLCYRLKQAGWKIYYLPGAQFIHYGGKSIELLTKGEGERLFFASMFRYLEKHLGRRGVLFSRWVLALDLILKMSLGLTLSPLSLEFREFVCRKWTLFRLCVGGSWASR